MNGLITASLRNPIAVTVMSLAIAVLGSLAAFAIPIDILPVFKSPAVQVLTFYGGMPAASIEKNITARMERGVVQASGGRKIESRSIVGVSIVRDYFRSNIDRSGALTETNSLAGWEFPTMPPGHIAAGRPALRSDEHDSRRPPGPGQRHPGRGRPLRHRPIRSPADDHVAAGRHRPAGLRRQGPGRHALPRPGQAPGPPPVPPGRPQGGRRLQRLPAHRQRQVRPDGLRHRLQLDVRPRRQHEGHPAPQRARQFRVPGRRGDAQGRQLHPDQRRAGQRQAPGLRPGLPPARGQHPLGRRHAPVVPGDDEGPADPRRDRPEAGDGPVGLRPPVDREPDGRGHPRGGPLLAGDPALPGRVADDGDRRPDDPHRGPGGPDRALCDGKYDQRDDAGRALAGDRPACRQRHHLPGEHPPASRPGGLARGGGLLSSTSII